MGPGWGHGMAERARGGWLLVDRSPQERTCVSSPSRLGLTPLPASRAELRSKTPFSARLACIRWHGRHVDDPADRDTDHNPHEQRNGRHPEGA